MPPEIGQAHAASAQGSVPPSISASKSLDAPRCASPATQTAPASLLLGKPPSSNAAGGSSSAATASDGTVDAVKLAQTKQRLELQLKELQLKRLKLLLAQKQEVSTSAPKIIHGSLAGKCSRVVTAFSGTPAAVHRCFQHLLVILRLH